MALDTLLETIAREGEAEVQRVVDDARVRAARVRAAADEAAEARCVAAIATHDREQGGVAASRRAAARAERREQVLRASERVLERIFAASERSFPHYFDGDSGRRALERLANQAMACFPGEHVVIRCRTGLVGFLERVAPPTARIVADDSVPEGLVVETADGSARVESTLVAALHRLRPALSIELLAAVRGRP